MPVAAGDCKLNVMLVIQIGVFPALFSSHEVAKVLPSNQPGWKRSAFGRTSLLLTRVDPAYALKELLRVNVVAVGGGSPGQLRRQGQI